MDLKAIQRQYGGYSEHEKFLRLYSSIRWILLSLIGTNRSAASRADLVKDSSILV